MLEKFYACARVFVLVKFFNRGEKKKRERKRRMRVRLMKNF